MLRIHDTLARRPVPFEPARPGRVSMYVCGPTVYDEPHLGHGRTAVVFDVIRRYLEWSGLRVTYVSNVTDVDDKIIARAAAEHVSEPDVAGRFAAAYWRELDRLGVARPTETPHATGYVPQMLALVRELVDTGHAYVVDGEGVYFSVETYPRYGELSGRRLDDLLEGAGARVDVDERKRSPVDFALWKAAKPGEPSWDSPWGPGRPGWHIECSAMSLDLLGDGFDIHGGGDDLAFPHHENERAQAEAAGHEFARHWIHSGMVMVGGEKMSKSLGNFTTLAEALDAHGGRAFRVAVLQTHYRSQTELGPAVLAGAERTVDGLDAVVRRARVAGIDAAAAEPDGAALDSFRAAMDDDFHTPSALGAVFDAVKAANVAIDAGEPARAAALVAAVVEATGALGLELDPDRRRSPGDARGASATAEIDELVRRRDAARKERDYAEADRLRDELADRGVVLEDAPTGTVWRYDR